jgi:putative hydrolase of the HAD superfamily
LKLGQRVTDESLVVSGGSRLVVWDLHGVLLSGRAADQDAFAAQVGLAAPAWQEIRGQYCDREHAWDRVETGTLSLGEFAIELSKRINAAGGRCSNEQAKGIWGTPSPFQASEPNEALLASIASSHGQVLHAIGTNNVRDWRRFWEPLLDITMFDWIFDSSEIGHRKPETGFWTYVETSTQVARTTVALIDDRLENIEAAIAYGWHGIHFSDTARCLRLFGEWVRGEQKGLPL